MHLNAGDRLGHYAIVSELGTGGTGRVYLARDVTLNRPVALKFPLQRAEPDSKARPRLLREAQAAGALDHPNIAAVYEVGEHESQPFIAMAYCPGDSLKACLACGPMPVSDTVSILAQVASGLAAAHDGGIVYLDLKPGNIMIGPGGQVRILDFGLAKITGPGFDTVTNATAAGSIVGTLGYMAPEQFRGGEADAAADIWAVGIITHEMPAGRHPFEGGSAASLMQAILEKAPSSLADARPDAPPELIGLAAAALQKDRARRRLTAAEAAEQARALLARLAAPGVRALSRPGRRRWMPRAAAAALIAVGTAMFLWHWARHAGKARWARDIALPRIEELAARIHGGISAGGERGALARRR